MRFTHFFRSSWILQLMVGIGLFLCSFFFEYLILRAFIAPGPMALFLAITLEVGKVTAIVWHYYLSHLSSQTYPGSVRAISTAFRVGLVVLSLLCSQLFLTARLDRPNLEAIKQAEIKAIGHRTDKDLAQMDKLYGDRKTALQLRHKSEYTHSRQRYAKRVEALETLLLKEMDNVVNGVFKGPRYAELNQRLEREKAAWETAVGKMQQRHYDEISGLDAEFYAARQSLMDRARDARAKVSSSDYLNDERVNNPHIVAFLKVTYSLFNLTLQPLQFVFVFSFLLSMLMEAGIMLAFATITVTMAPVLRAQHEETIEKEALKTRIHGEARRDEMNHEAAMGRIHKTGQRTVQRVKAEFQDKIDPEPFREAG